MQSQPLRTGLIRFVWHMCGLMQSPPSRLWLLAKHALHSDKQLPYIMYATETAAAVQAWPVVWTSSSSLCRQGLSHLNELSFWADAFPHDQRYMHVCADNCTPSGAPDGFDEEIRDVCIALANGLAESANKGELMQSSKVDDLEVRRDLVQLAASVCAISMQTDIGGKDGTCFSLLLTAS